MILAIQSPPAQPSTALELRRCARRARDIAVSLIGDPAEQRLLKLAEEYEARAAQIAAKNRQQSADSATICAANAAPR